MVLPNRDAKSQVTTADAATTDSAGAGRGDTLPDIVNLYAKAGPPATRTEVLSYYAFFAGNNGIGAYQ